MEIWLDSIDVDLVTHAYSLGILHGVTTNPAILAECNDKKARVQTLLTRQEGPLAFQVNGTTAQEMINEACDFHALSDRIIIKVPVTQEGLKAIHYLSKNGIKIMATVIFHEHQYLLSARAGADYAAPYFSAISKMGEDAREIVSRMCFLRDRYRFKTKILAASFQNMEQVDVCLHLGVDAVTMKNKLFQSFIEDRTPTLERLKLFRQSSINHYLFTNEPSQ